MKKLYILRPLENLKKENDPWACWYNKSFGFVVSACSESEARSISAKNAGDEADYGFGNPWLNYRYSSCVELLAKDFDGVVIQDFHRA